MLKYFFKAYKEIKIYFVQKLSCITVATVIKELKLLYFEFSPVKRYHLTVGKHFYCLSLAVV